VLVSVELIALCSSILLWINHRKQPDHIGELHWNKEYYKGKFIEKQELK
jgi:hypothetical protein